jgi:tight adherence protein B
VLIASSVFIVVLVTVYGAYWALVARPEQHEQRSVLKRLKTGKRSIAAVGLARGRERLSSVPIVENALVRLGNLMEPARRLLERSDVRWTLGTLVLASVFAGLTVAAVVSVVAHVRLVGVVAGAVAATAPYLFLRFKAAKRQAIFEEQFPMAVDLIARALRAGHALPTALQMVGDEIPQPVGGEFRTLFEQQNFGLAFPDALRAFAERVGLLDARFFVTAVLTQRESGGNLSEVLDRLSAVIRERFKVKRQVRAVSAHGRITGVVLSLLPPAVAGLLLLVSPQHIRLLVEDPLGVDMLATALVLQVIGVFVIRRIVDVEY